jgi:hypothetical protein
MGYEPEGWEFESLRAIHSSAFTWQCQYPVLAGVIKATIVIDISRPRLARLREMGTPTE